jgi:uncharacterized protein YkwD
MMPFQNRHALQMILLSAALTLSACGGGSDSSATTNNTSTPASTDTPAAGGTSGGTAAPALVCTDTSGTPIGATSGIGGIPATMTVAAECPFGDYKSGIVAEINAMRASPRTCGGTTYPAACKLSWNASLASAAEVHSNDMAVTNYADHPDANGVRIGGRASAAGYSYGYVGENIAAGQTSVSQVVASWMASESHCKNIMTASFYDMAVSCKYNPSAAYQYYWTLTMGNH